MLKSLADMQNATHVMLQRTAELELDLHSAEMLLLQDEEVMANKDLLLSKFQSQCIVESRLALLALAETASLSSRIQKQACELADIQAELLKATVCLLILVLVFTACNLRLEILANVLYASVQCDHLELA